MSYLTNTAVSDILEKKHWSKRDLQEIFSLTDPADIEKIRDAAEQVLLRECGSMVYYRGLIEFSNVCTGDCLYCGIRKSNHNVERYSLSKEEIIDAAVWCADQGYGSIVLQSGERRDEPFVQFVESVVGEIKQRTTSKRLPQGVGITLCVGEQDRETYRRFREAGAHRYLLRIETTSPELFARIHPGSQSYSGRKKALETLREEGFQVGTGVMIGLPGQTVEDLANDILFFRDMDIDMIGMGPYIPHSQTPMARWSDELLPPESRILHSFLMIAATRLVLRDVNIAATTALQALQEDGREVGLTFGANIIMPQLTPTEVRKQYLLYEGKPCIDENATQCRACLSRRIISVGRTVGIDNWGDSHHALNRCRSRQIP